MTKTAPRRGFSVPQILALPALPSATDAFEAMGISNDLGYDLIRRNEFPIEVIKFGSRVLRVRRSDLLIFLGIAEENSDAAGGPAPAASNERITETA